MAANAHVTQRPSPVCVMQGKVHLELRHFYTQDGVNWADLDDISAEEAAVCAKVNTQFTGDPAYVYQARAGRDGDGAGAACGRVLGAARVVILCCVYLQTWHAFCGALCRSVAPPRLLHTNHAACLRVRGPSPLLLSNAIPLPPSLSGRKWPRGDPQGGRGGGRGGGGRCADGAGDQEAQVPVPDRDEGLVRNDHRQWVEWDCIADLC